ncbi:MAG: HNH endonuclease [Candidatus Dadabacteria bacterium]|nr:HNH endonuclease [Candidatus Dadabacteria bacterium]
MLSSPVLVLNRNYLPVSVTNLRRAFVMLYCGDAKAVSDTYETFDFESWAQVSAARSADGEYVRTVNRIIRAPRVIILLRYGGFHRKSPKFNRLNIFRRDGGKCQYCGRGFPRSELTIDHVIPRSLGGTSRWDNVVCSCGVCNRKKGGRTPEQARMKLLTKPDEPKWGPFAGVFARAIRYKEWEPFVSFVDASYWNVELEG